MKKTMLLVLVVLLIVPVTAHAVDVPKGRLYIPAIDLNEEIHYAPVLVNEKGKHYWDQAYWEGYKVAYLGGVHGDPWIDDLTYNVILVSHTYGPLHDIIYLALGDEIYIEDGKYEALYKVSEIYITDISDTLPVGGSLDPIVTLIICWGDGRYVVRAQLHSLKDQYSGSYVYGN